MIFTTVGLGVGFNRLVKMVDDLASNSEEIFIIQLGRATYKPITATYFTFGDLKKMGQHYQNSEIVITHGGVGSIMTALSFKKPVIVVPRLYELGEVMDHHQLEITNTFYRLGFILSANNIVELEKAIQNIKNGTYKQVKYDFGLERAKLIAYLKSYLNELNAR